MVGHCANHVLGQYIAFRQAEEYVCPLDGFCQRVEVTTVGRKVTLGFVQFLTVAGDDTLGVEHDDVFVSSAQGFVELGTGNGGSTGSVHYDTYIFNFLACHFEGIQKSGCRDDGRTMLVIVHHRDVQFFLQATFDFKTFRSLDVFQVDASESRGNRLDCFDELFRVLFVHFDVKNIDSTVYFEQKSLSFHHRFAGHGTDVAKSQNGRTVGNDSHQISFGGVFISILWILLYFETRFGYAGGVGERKVCLCAVRLGWNHLNLARLAL